MLKRVAVALLALLLLGTVAASPASAHRGPPGHDHAEPRPPTQNIPPVANDLAFYAGGAAVAGGSAATGFLYPHVAVAVSIVEVTKIVNDHLYQGYTGPSDSADRNRPTSSRVPPSAHG